MAMRRLLSPNTPDVAIRLFCPLQMDHGSHYSLPTTPEQAALIVDVFSIEANRNMSTCEAVWHMIAFDIHVREPSVEGLAVHPPNMNRVIYDENANLSDAIHNSHKYKTIITEWSVANRRFPDARSLTHLEFHPICFFRGILQLPREKSVLRSWDEVLTTLRCCFEAVDRSMRDVFHANSASMQCIIQST